MRTYLTTALVVTGLLTSIAGLADNDLSSCLQENANKPDKNTYCISQMQLSAIEARKKSMDDSYNQAKSEIAKQQPPLPAKPGAPVPPVATMPTPSSSPSSTTTEPATTSNTTGTTSPGASPSPSSAESTSSGTQSNTAISPPNKQPAQQPTGFGKKPASVQWY